ncbi:MAG: lipoyl synthase [Chloroflexi bacterium]|nr:lipoyl synthase [Chloroflexota bacterium]HCH35559.1 lipoyl synthase [Dehalococcoidia bacterium]
MHIQGIIVTTPNPKKRLPEWLKVRWVGGENYLGMRKLLRSADLHTVCEEASCPNIGECWERKSATFMILGDICTRACRYCDVTSGKPQTLDLQEPLRLAKTVQTLDLNYCVITSVNRDDLPDGGASIFAECLNQINRSSPNCKVEILTPDFAGNLSALHTVLHAQPAVFNHNLESVRRIFKSVRSKGDYDLSLSILEEAQRYAPDIPTKSGLMVGLGETADELHETFKDLRNVGVKLLTIGQYLRPSQKHIEMDRFYTPSEFTELEQDAYSLGFDSVAAGPLVRSSYHADEQHAAATAI